jgi:two-component system, sensor histidine kinase LadS
MLIYKYTLFLLLVAQTVSALGEKTILVDSRDTVYEVSQDYFSIYETEDSTSNIGEIIKRDDQFIINHGDYVNINNKKHYWIRFSVKNDSPYEWILEGYNYRVDQMDFYTLLNGVYVKISSNYAKPASHKFINHKNFVFPLNIPKGAYKTYYLHMYHGSDTNTPQILVIKSNPYFTSYALFEYFLLGVFYGCLILMMLYNILIFVILRDVSHLYYVLYLSFGILFFLNSDGIGNQYFWNGNKIIATNIVYVVIFLQAVFLFLYVREFLDIENKLRNLNIIFWAYTAFRFTIIIFGFFVSKKYLYLYYADLPLFVMAFVVAIIAYKNQRENSSFLMIGFGFLLSGFLVYVLRVGGIIAPDFLSFYYLHFATLAEMMMLSLAMGGRFGIIKREYKEERKNNKLLEEKVQERTMEIIEQKKIIEEKINDLDNIIYRSSHDIKGPLKSIEGLAMVGKLDLDNAIEYFDHIELSVKKLDDIVSGLGNSSDVLNYKVKLEPVDVKSELEQLMESIKDDKDYEMMHIFMDIEQNHPFITDKYLTTKVFRYIIDNALKYRKKGSIPLTLVVKAQIDKEALVISFTDNGIGMDAKTMKNLFSMFFKGTYQQGTGLSLFITKLAIDKLKGKIDLKSDLGIGTEFQIKIPNQSSS